MVVFPQLIHSSANLLLFETSVRYIEHRMIFITSVYLWFLLGQHNLGFRSVSRFHGNSGGADLISFSQKIPANFRTYKLFWPYVIHLRALYWFIQVYAILTTHSLRLGTNGTYNNQTGATSPYFCQLRTAGNYCHSAWLSEPAGLCDLGWSCVLSLWDVQPIYLGNDSGLLVCLITYISCYHLFTLFIPSNIDPMSFIKKIFCLVTTPYISVTDCACPADRVLMLRYNVTQAITVRMMD